MRIKEEINCDGDFWLPSAPDKRISGTLNISDGGKIELEVLGAFHETAGEQTSAINDRGVIERIIGRIEKYGFVTLDGCFYKYRPLFSGDFSKSLLHVGKALLGVAYDDKEPILTKTIQFSVEGVDEWIGLSGINVDYQEETRTAIIKYSPLKEVSLNLNDDMQLLITFSWTHPGFPNITEAKITQKTYFKLLSQQERQLGDFTSLAHKLTTFLCFAIDKPVCINQIAATVKTIRRGPNDQDINNGTPELVSIPLYYASLPYTKEVPKIGWYHMLFRYQRIEVNADRIINNWLQAYARFERALDLYFAVFTGRILYLEDKVVALAHGLEIYHRRTSEETRIDNSEFERLIETLRKLCPEEHQKWLCERLKYGNELSLRKRLQKIAEPFNDFIGDKSERDKLIGSIVDTRNFLTHYDGSLESRAASGDKLVRLYRRMEAIFQLLILQELGFPRTEIQSFLAKNDKLRQKLKAI